MSRRRRTRQRRHFGGQLIQPDGAAYDEARQIYNSMIDRRPALIARPTGAADVIAAVRFAREQGLPIGVRCGGHSVAGHSVPDGGVLLDLSLMKGIHVDPERGVARANGGVLCGEYDRETQALGLHTPGGRVTSTGVGGFTTGGGYGWTSTKYGLTCDNLVSADVVTADGRFVTASETENEDLFWGLRGGSGNFGVVRRSSTGSIRWGRSCSARCSSSRWNRPRTPSRRTATSSRMPQTSWRRPPCS